MFDYPLLEALYAVEKSGNFESVAKSHGVTKSAISQSLRLLEQRMGAVTVCRNSIKPTYFGSQLCRHLEHIKLLENKFLADHEELFYNIDQSSVAVSVAVNHDSLSSWFQDVLVDARRLFKQFHLDIEVSDELMTNQLLRSGKCLAAILTKKDPLDGFVSLPLGQHQYHATASPQFVEKNFSQGVTKESLETATMVRAADTNNLADLWAHEAIGTNISCSINTHTLGSSHGIVEACLRGKAWSVTSALQVSEHIASGDLVELIPGKIFTENLFWHINHRVTSPLSNLTNTIRSAAANSLIQDFCDA